MFWLLLAGSFILGVTQVFANGPLSAIFQSTVEPDMQGRVFSLIGAGATAMMPLSLLIAGPISDWLGVRVWFVFGGTVCILMAVAALFIPALMNIEFEFGGPASRAGGKKRLTHKKNLPAPRAQGGF